jgi:hypothetical protein
MTTAHLNGHHRKTLAGIFTHPAPHNIEWHDVISLLDNLGTATERHGGGYTVAIGAEHMTLVRPHGHDVVDDELRHLRAFLTKAGLAPAGGPVQSLHDLADGWIVLIDHHQARLYAPGGDHAAPLVIRPDDDDGSRRRLEHKQGNDDHDGGHMREDDGYYQRIAADLADAPRIVVLSDGKGRANAGAYLIAYVRRHCPAIAAHIVAVDTIDIAHTSDAQAVAAGHALLKAA